MVVITLYKGHNMLGSYVVQCPQMVLITLYEGPMMVGSYVA